MRVWFNLEDRLHLHIFSCLQYINKFFHVMKRKLPFIHIEMKKENNVIIKVASYFNHYNSKVNVYTCVEKNVVE